MFLRFKNKWLIVLSLTAVACLVVIYSKENCFKSHTLSPHWPIEHYETVISYKFNEQEYTKRQGNLFRLLNHVDKSCNENIVVLLGKTVTKRSFDINYEFFQDTDILYLTGQKAPNEVYILEYLNTTNHVLVFTNQSSEMIPQAINSHTHIYQFNEIKHILRNRYSQNNTMCIWHKSYGDNNDQKIKEIVDNILFAHDSTQRKVIELGYLIEMLRLFKTDSEIRLIRKASEMIGQIFKEIMKWNIDPGNRISASFLSSYIEFRCKVMGFEAMAFSPVINHGRQSVMNNAPHSSMGKSESFESTDWIMLDAGCHFAGYATDITRTWPLTSLGEQRKPYVEIYNIVLSAHADCLTKLSKPAPVTLQTLNDVMLTSLSNGLQKLGIINSSLSANKKLELVRKFCPHFVGHYIGLDVHDSPSVHTGLAIQPGMVFTLEPGLYVPLGIKYAPLRYHGINVRIENMILMTKTGTEVLTSAASTFKPS